MTAARNQPIDARTISLSKKNEARVIYKKDSDLTKVGFQVFEEADRLAQELKKKYPEPGHRVRTRLRSRTSGWDVVVKVRTEVAV
jgi:hypothetical protein